MQSKQEYHVRPPLPGAGVMENYTVAFLVSAGVLCFVGLFVLWAALGLPFVIVCAVLADRAMRR